MTRVEVTKPFRDDLSRHIVLLMSAGEWGRVERVAIEVTTLNDRLVRFPEIGRELLGHPGHTLRRIALGRSPYFAWYRFDRRSNGVRLTRLFHAHQRTPARRL